MKLLNFSNHLLVALLVWVGTPAPLIFGAGKYHRGVGEIEPPQKRKKVFGSDREPAVLNLNAEVEALSDLNAQISEQLESVTSKTQELFFKKFKVVDEKIILFGDKLTGILNCSEKSGATLVISNIRKIDLKTSKLPPGSRLVGFKDDELCRSALTVFKSDPKGEARLIVAEIHSEKVIRLDIR